MDTNARYYWRRTCEEMAAAFRAVTPAGRVRHEHFVRLFVERLKELNAPCPFSDEELAQMLSVNGEKYSGAPIFRWQPESTKQSV
jgi:hypothetical protein